jgi:hypothetical protein
VATAQISPCLSSELEALERTTRTQRLLKLPWNTCCAPEVRASSTGRQKSVTGI